MKAAILEKFGTPLVVREEPDPVLGTGEVVVDVVAAGVLAYSGEVLSGARQYLLTLPAVPSGGAIGRVRALGPDATRLRIGDWVYCDPTVRSRDDALMPDITLQGISARGEGGLKLQRHHRHGAWAQQMRVPTENAVALGDLDTETAVRYVAIGSLLVPYGGLLAIGLQAGETILVNGATGKFGSAGVAVALAMGAGRVVAAGRNRDSLRDLECSYGSRVQGVALSGDEATDRAAMLQAANAPIDCVLDLLPPQADPSWARTAIMSVRQNGRVVLMGGIGMQGGGGLDVPYAWLMRNCIALHGQWMYPREAVPRMVGLLRAGLIDLVNYDVTPFALEQVNEAVAHAAATAGPFAQTVLRIG